MDKDTPEVIAPADQTSGVGDNATPTEVPVQAVSLADIAGMHVEARPGFDPAIHATGPDGAPRKKADGSYAMKRGRKAGSASSPLPPKDTNSASVKSEAAPDVTVSAPVISSEEAARQSANLVINGAVFLCGEEIGVPKNKEEAEGLKFSFKNYYDVRGVPNLPPEIGLIVGVGLYIAPRLREAEKKTGKITNIINAIKIKFAEMRG